MISLSIVTIGLEFDNEFYNTVNSLKPCLINKNVQLLWIISDLNSVLENERLGFELHGINFEIIKGEDSGIFDAMNIGVKHSIGDYVWFLNSGDLASKKAAGLLEEVSAGKDFYSFGVTNHFLDLYYTRYSTAQSPCHQGFICRRNVLMSNPFDTDYPLSADHKVMKSIIVNGNGVFINKILAIYDNSGLTSLPRLSRWQLAQNESLGFKVVFVVKALFITIIGKRAFIRFINEVVNRRHVEKRL